MQVTRRLIEEAKPRWSMRANGSSQDPQNSLGMRKGVGGTGTPMKSTILNTGESGPTSAQLLAAELAEELYGTSTTFVQADPSNFRELVQKLTGSTPDPNVSAVLPLTLTLGRESNACRSDVPRNSSAGIKSAAGPGPHRTSTFKLQERRQNAKKVELKQLLGGSVIRSGYGNPSPALSPVSPFTALDIFENQDASSSSSFSPKPCSHLTISTPDSQNNSEQVVSIERLNSQPQLLSLFPLKPFDH